MPDLRKMWTRVSLETNVRTVHKLYEALNGARNGKIVTLEDDVNLAKFFELCEMILEKSGYMKPAEILAIKRPPHGAPEVKG